MRVRREWAGADDRGRELVGAVGYVLRAFTPGPRGSLFVGLAAAGSHWIPAAALERTGFRRAS